jgi:hypothetical protein
MLGNLALAFKGMPDGVLLAIKPAYPGTDQETATGLLQHMVTEERRFLFGDESNFGYLDALEATAEQQTVRQNMVTRKNQRATAWPEG